MRQTLLSVEAACMNTCSVCQTYWKTDEVDNMSCESCKITSDLEMVTRCLRPVTVEPDGYNGYFLTFIDEKMLLDLQLGWKTTSCCMDV